MKNKSFFDSTVRITSLRKRSPLEIMKRMKKINSRGGCIDKRILGLVVGLNCWGIRTDMSCQGHKNSKKPYPWITIEWKYLLMAARVLLEWNYKTHKDLFNKKSIFWIINPMATPEIKPLPTLPLEDLQKDAIAFGKFLQKLPKNHQWKE